MLAKVVIDDNILMTKVKLMLWQGQGQFTWLERWLDGIDKVDTVLDTSPSNEPIDPLCGQLEMALIPYMLLMLWTMYMPLMTWLHGKHGIVYPNHRSAS